MSSNSQTRRKGPLPSTWAAIIWVIVLASLVVCYFTGLLDPLLERLVPPSSAERYSQASGYHSAVMTMRKTRRLVGFLFLCFLCNLVAGIFYAVLSSREKRAEVEAGRAKMRALASGHLELPAKEFLAMPAPQEFTGVYILHNVDKDMYYVGQSVRVPQRVRQHLTGHGNGDVYADYKYGDEFTVRTISLTGSGYLSIDDLDRDMIDAYDAYESGYNGTRGNGFR